MSTARRLRLTSFGRRSTKKAKVIRKTIHFRKQSLYGEIAVKRKEIEKDKERERMNERKKERKATKCEKEQAANFSPISSSPPN